MNPAEQVLQYHIRIGHDVPLGKYCLLPGDPGRCAAIAAHFDDPVHQTTNREYCTWTGTLLGQPVSVCSTGIGGPSAVIALEELTQLGVTTFLRVGTCIEFPAVADFQVTTALVQAAQKLGKPFHTGVVQCKDSFYGQHNPKRMPVSYELLAKWEAWKRLGVLASEMESAALFVAANALGVRCGSCFHVVWNQERQRAGLDQTESHDTESAIQVGIEAIKLMIQQDQNT